MRAGNQEERRSARRLLFYATTSAAVPDLAAFDSRLPHIRMSFRDGPKDQARNLEIPGSRGACHRAALSADPLARPGMTLPVSSLRPTATIAAAAARPGPDR